MVDEAIKKIETIFIDANILDSIKVVTEVVNDMKLDSYSDLSSLITKKKTIILDNVKDLKFTEDNMNSYYDMIIDTTKTIKEGLKKSLSKTLENGNKELGKLIINNNELVSNRLDDYLNNRLYEKLETKIHMEIMLRDNNLINKAKEGYLRYQEICSKTLV